MAAKVRLTREGYERLKAELERLREQRREVIEEVKKTREDGDLRENFGYHAARQAYGIIEGQIAAAEMKLAEAEILENGEAITEIDYGIPFRVLIEETGDELDYVIVDGTEVGFTDNAISADSPIGEALLYLQVGDTAEAETPAGLRTYTITAIEG